MTGLLRKTGSAVHALSGTLYVSSSGWALLSVPNALVRGTFDALKEQGIELPPSFSGGPFNAHITVLRPEEIRAVGGPGKITERGQTFRYSLGILKSFKPDGWEGIGRCWVIEVRSPELEALRKSYGLSAIPHDGEYPFHITVAVRRSGVLGENEVSKAASISGNAGGSNRMFYHGTYPDRIESILASGLDPSYAGEGGGSLPGLDEKDPGKKLWLTSHPGYAKWYAGMAAKTYARRKAEAEGKGWVRQMLASHPAAPLLEVNLPVDFPVTSIGGKGIFGDEHYVKDLISPEHIRVHKQASISGNADKIPGGLADDKTDDDFPAAAIEQGKQVEQEHTSDPAIAAEITRDHLVESPEYYDRLEEVEKAAEPTYLQRGLSAQLQQPSFDADQSLFSNVLLNAQAVRDRAQAQVKDRDAVQDLRSAFEPGFALQRFQRFLREGDHVQNPLDKAMLR